jgi:hypothetical protein
LLAGRVRTIKRDVLDPHGLTAAGLILWAALRGQTGRPLGFS